jgi:hypothetical protein
MPKAAEAPPTALARRFVRYVVGFGVGVGVATLVFLTGGLFKVIPNDLRSIALPTSTLLMGLVAVGVQFYARESILRRTLRRLFTAGVVVLVAGVVLFLCLHLLFVETYEARGRDVALTVVLVGERLPGCRCKAGASNEDCVLGIGHDRIDTCWASSKRKTVRILLLLTYLLTTIGFGVLVGFVVVQEEMHRAARRRRKPRKRESPAGDAGA